MERILFSSRVILSFPVSPAVLLISHLSSVCMDWIASMINAHNTTNCCKWCPCQIILHVKEFDDTEEQFCTICTSEKRESVCILQPVAFCLVVYRAEWSSRSLCYSANQPVIPVLLMWEVMLHVTLSFSHQCPLCLCLYLSLPLNLRLRDCCFSVIGPLFWLARRASPLGLFTWIHASRLLANATPLFF